MKKLGIALTLVVFLIVLVDAMFFFYGLPKVRITGVTLCSHNGALLGAIDTRIRIPYKLRYLNFYLPFSPSLCDIHLKKYRGNAEDIKFLNSHLGAFDITTQNSPGMYGLRNRRKNEENLKFLISKGLDINAVVDYGTGPITSLYHAVDRGEIEATQILLDNGADPNIRDKQGFTPLERQIKLKEEQLGSGYDSSKDISGVIGILKETQSKK